MDIEILGASGSMGIEQYTTCVKINDNILLDAGSGLNLMSFEALEKIQAVLLTHAHLDHIGFLPFMIDAMFEFYVATKPLKIYALPVVIESIREGIFNWKTWPDFEVLPSKEKPSLEFIPIELDKEIEIEGIKIKPFYAEHYGACGYKLDDGHKSFAFTGDTTINDTVMQALNSLGELDALLIECAFPNSMHEKCLISAHVSPKMLQQTLDELEYKPKQVWATHLKPRQREELIRDISELASDVKIADTKTKIRL